MNNYNTVTEALNDLNQRGYTLDFSLLTDKDCIYCHGTNHSLRADDFVIDEVYRFEGETDPADEMIVYAISAKKEPVKGVLLNAYGIYADSNNAKVVEKLAFRGNKTATPIKRAKELIQLSREHHHVLLLSWKIKTGMAKKVAADRIQSYVHWFYRNHLMPHFELEEKIIFPLLGASNPKKDIALQQHQAIRNIAEKEILDYNDLDQLQRFIQEHIRFEEREVFHDIQESGRIEELQGLAASGSNGKFTDNESDPFWK
jgi:hypothetical protein